jgi:hypothetical protein
VHQSSSFTRKPAQWLAAIVDSSATKKLDARDHGVIGWNMLDSFAGAGVKLVDLFDCRPQRICTR